MKCALIVAQFACIVSLLWAGHWKPYRLLLALLAASTLHCALFQTNDAFLRQWYTLLETPVMALRFAAALEVSYRQTAKYQLWARLMGACFLLGTAYAASIWSISLSEPLETFVSVRRYPQIWCAAFFVVLEAFWVCKDEWKGRLVDWMALLYGVVCVNHGVISTMGLIQKWTWDSWEKSRIISWSVDSFAWFLMCAALLIASRQRKSSRPVAPTCGD